MASKSRLTTEPERANPVVPLHVWRSPAGAPADICVQTELSVYGEIEAHCRAALPNETGGFLLGKVGWDPGARIWMLYIDESVPVLPATQTPVHFSFTWREVDRVRGRREAAGKALLGWYHTHPEMGIFLSDTDVDKTHRVLFSEPFQIALVYDPVCGRAGYFFWDNDHVLDPSQAPWREFQIASDDESPAPAPTPSRDLPVEIVGSGQGVQAGGLSDSPLARQFRMAAARANASVPKAAAAIVPAADEEPPSSSEESSSTTQRADESTSTTLRPVTWDPFETHSPAGSTIGPSDSPPAEEVYASGELQSTLPRSESPGMLAHSRRMSGKWGYSLVAVLLAVLAGFAMYFYFE